jgi:hypothetical protein
MVTDGVCSDLVSAAIGAFESGRDGAR